MMNTTHATVVATETFANRYSSIPFNILSDTGLRVSQAGYGSYRVDTSLPEHRESLRHAITSGINLIDTSANYTGGGSELLIGSVVEDLENEGVIGRDQLVIVSKVGYLQGRVYRLSQNLKKNQRGYPDLVEYAVGLEHCIHPAFIEDQLTASLSRLNCGSIDAYLLHNPEYYLGWAARNGIDVATARAEYYRRIKLAFEHLEKEVARGRIRCYGVSSNTFPAVPDDPEFTSLEKLISIANEISPLNRFKAIQLPFNLIETGCAIVESQSDNKTVLELARIHSMAVLTNRPLNAIFGNGLVRLSEENPNKDRIKSLLKKADPDWGLANSLSQMAVRSLRSSLGITSVLIGMRQRPYVDDVMQELHSACRIEDRKSSWLKVSSYLTAEAGL